MEVRIIVDMCNKMNAKYHRIKEEMKNAFSILLALYLFYAGPIISIFITTMIFLSPFSGLLLWYFVWMYMDHKTPYVEGRRIEWIRNLSFYRRAFNSLPINLIKTSELPEDRNYIFCIAPHGILSCSAFFHFGTKFSDFSKLFPKLNLTIHTLNSNFFLPFVREFNLGFGFSSVSKECLTYRLTKPSGQAVAIVPGGAAEAALTRPGKHRVALKNRKGFVKLALTTGSDLVPVYTFGETDLFDHFVFPENSVISKVQQKIKKYFGVFPAVYNGTFLFNVGLGPLPRCTPSYTIVGKPIRVNKTNNPDDCAVDELHRKFLDELVSLFDEHKYTFVADPENTSLSIE